MGKGELKFKWERNNQRIRKVQSEEELREEGKVVGLE